jgi:hypothetical protein
MSYFVGPRSMPSSRRGEVTATEKYGRFLIVSRPISNPVKEVWHPYARILWHDAEGYHSYSLQNPQHI